MSDSKTTSEAKFQRVSSRKKKEKEVNQYEIEGDEFENAIKTTTKKSKSQRTKKEKLSANEDFINASKERLDLIKDKKILKKMLLF